MMAVDSRPTRGESRQVVIPPHGLPGILRRPADATGLVVFAHGSGSSRLSPRNNAVADALARQGLASLLFDLLTPREEADRENVFDIALLADRLIEAIDWCAHEDDLASLPVGLFGASTGAAAAIVAAARLGDRINAVVSRGGRPDLAGDALRQMNAPTLLIIGGADVDVVQLNEAAATEIRAPKQLIMVPRATHLFEEAGALELVADHAARWFKDHFAASELH